ncbi:hypothetical protein P691DRAFT_814645 [Macrolepiota fuliginosa MF-IS2]|uniref:Uncharacterized protein n=1 Tax=Macrolepiota fuliginosa MF-IS2 TaxID=1400762 RepID=A0A9P5XNF2_9AGAR|nr:hypothetical protein P691DRAFT_814645 [Macrolepiota fuliginosa MF-IS2]
METSAPIPFHLLNWGRHQRGPSSPRRQAEGSRSSPSTRFTRALSDISKAKEEVEGCISEATSLEQRIKELENSNKRLKVEKEELTARLQAKVEKYKAMEEANETLTTENKRLKDQLSVVSKFFEIGRTLQFPQSPADPTDSEHHGEHAEEMNTPDDRMEKLEARVRKLERVTLGEEGGLLSHRAYTHFFRVRLSTPAPPPITIVEKFSLCAHPLSGVIFTLNKLRTEAPKHPCLTPRAWLCPDSDQPNQPFPSPRNYGPTAETRQNVYTSCRGDRGKCPAECSARQTVEQCFQDPKGIFTADHNKISVGSLLHLAQRIESCLFQATSLGQRAKEAEDKNELLERERNDLAEEVRRLQAMNKEYEAREEALKKENNSLKDQLLVISRIPEAAGELLRLMASAGSQRINGHLGEINVSDE